jgi:hypothetical protein
MRSSFMRERSDAALLFGARFITCIMVPPRGRRI